MPDKWMSVVEAAATLKVHTRTIERRIASGKIQARRTDDGLLQVLVRLPEEADTTPAVALEAVRELADNQVHLATGSASALVKFAQDDAHRAREELALVRQEAGRARRSAVLAWCVVAFVGVGVCVAVGWTTQRITRANEDVRHLSEYAERMEAEARQLKEQYQQERQRLLTERDIARQQAERARLESAEASGRLAAYIEQHKYLLAQSGKGPTTRPMSLLERIASAFTGAE